MRNVLKKEGEKGFEKLYYRGKEIILKVDNSTTVEFIPSPSKWKCKTRKCLVGFRHKHSLFAELKKQL